MQITVLKPDLTEEQLPSIPSFDELRRIVGGYVELSSGRVDGRVVQLVVNEDGFSLGLPYNAKATEIFRRNRKPEGQGDFLVGTVVMLDGCRLP